MQTFYFRNYRKKLVFKKGRNGRYLKRHSSEDVLNVASVGVEGGPVQLQSSFHLQYIF
jgi:hypothetical protein